MAAGEFNDLRHFCFRHLEGEDAANADAVAVDVQHDLHGFLAILVEYALQDVNHKLHRRVIVVEQQHIVERGLFGLRARFRDDTRAGSRTVVPAIVALAAHAGRL